MGHVAYTEQDLCTTPRERTASKTTSLGQDPTSSSNGLREREWSSNESPTTTGELSRTSPSLELRFIEEPAVRLSAILTDEVHIGKLPLDLERTAIDNGMDVLPSTLPAFYVFQFLGGQFYNPTWSSRPLESAKVSTRTCLIPTYTTMSPNCPGSMCVCAAH